MNFSYRKNLRLQNYDYSKPGAYFLTLCTKNKEELFGKVVGGDAHIAPRVSLSDYGFVVKKYIKNIKGLDKYIIMPNHIHLIIFIKNPNDGSMRASTPTTKSQSISSIIKSLKTLVTKEIGFSLWQHSFYDRIIRNKNEYDKICKYIYDNPTKWETDCYYKHN